MSKSRDLADLPAGSGDINIDSGTLFVDASENKVGVGTTSPNRPLQVAMNSAGATVFSVKNDGAVNAQIGFQGSGSANDANCRIGVASDTDFVVITGNSESLRVDDSGNVGIGTTSPDANLEISSSSINPAILWGRTPYSTYGSFLLQGGSFYSHTDVDGNSTVNVGASRYLVGNGIHYWYTSGSTAAGSPRTFTERMRLDSSGNLAVGYTGLPSGTNTGFYVSNTGYIYGSAAQTVAYFSRASSDGAIAEFRKDGSVVGAIGCGGSGTIFTWYGAFASGAGLGVYSNVSIRPLDNTGAAADNAVDLGHSSARFDDIFATNGTIQTSDRNEKQDIETLSEAEQRVAVAAKSLLRKFRWKSAVEEKGDDARIHFGIIAQDLQAAFEAEGLDAGRYAMFIYSEWWETYTDVPAVEAQDGVYETVTDEEGNETQVLVSEAVEAKEAYTRTDTYDTEAEAPEGAVKKSRMGVRYSELLAFIIAAI